MGNATERDRAAARPSRGAHRRACPRPGVRIDEPAARKRRSAHVGSTRAADPGAARRDRGPVEHPLLRGDGHPAARSSAASRSGARATLVADQAFEVVWASSLSRAAESARILAPGHAIRLEADFREVDFGRWEGLTREEIAALRSRALRDLAARSRPLRLPGRRAARGFSRAHRARPRTPARERESARPSSSPTRASCGRCSSSSSGETLASHEPELGGVIHVGRDDRASGEREARSCRSRGSPPHITPWASIASATLMKPPRFAPRR